MSLVPDLGVVCDQHVAAEFAEKDVDATMATMVEDPYVWHVPALTGAAAGKVAYEHIYWDQASVLVQIGLLDPSHSPSPAPRRPSAYSNSRPGEDPRPS
jgi:hypothetical protein